MRGMPITTPVSLDRQAGKIPFAVRELAQAHKRARNFLLLGNERLVAKLSSPVVKSLEGQRGCRQEHRGEITQTLGHPGKLLGL